MADVTTFTSWSSTASINKPTGGTAIGAGLDDNLREIQAQIAAWRDAMGWGVLNGTSVSGTNTVVASTSPSPTLASGQTYRIVPANSNTGAASFNPNSAGAKDIFLNGSALVGYELRKNCPVELYYDGTQFNIIAGAHGGDGVPIGNFSDRGFATAPSGHLLCDGSAVSRTTYADLFSVISTTYGTGDGSTTFNVPNMARRVAVGSGGTGTSTLANTVGSTGGEETHTLTDSEVPDTAVEYSGPTAHDGDSGGTSNVPMFDDTNQQTVSDKSWGTVQGGGGAHNNLPPSLVVYKCIKH